MDEFMRRKCITQKGEEIRRIQARDKEDRVLRLPSDPRADPPFVLNLLT